MKSLMTVLLFFQGFNAMASLDGKYTLLNGPSSCPEGHIVLKKNKDQKMRNLLFGSRNFWELNEQDKGFTKEVVEGGCTYLVNYNLTSESFTAETVRSGCPDKFEISKIKEFIEFKNKKLTYKMESLLANNVKNEFGCEYEKNK